MPGRLTGRGGPVRMWFSVAQRRQEGQEGRSGEGFWGKDVLAPDATWSVVPKEGRPRGFRPPDPLPTRHFAAVSRLCYTGRPSRGPEPSGMSRNKGWGGPCTESRSSTSSPFCWAPSSYCAWA